MKTPDIRGRVIEHVLERAYRAGVDDIHLIAALALHRRMTPAELKRAVGPRIFDEFYPDRLYNHDAEDPGRDRQPRRDRATARPSSCPSAPPSPTCSST